MTALEASVISMHLAATPVQPDQGEGISAGFRCISVSVSVSASGLVISARTLSKPQVNVAGNTRHLISNALQNEANAALVMSKLCCSLWLCN